MSAASAAYSVPPSDPVESAPSESVGAPGARLSFRAMKTLVIVAFLAVILYNLGAGLYYMLVDDSSSKRTVNALTKRIALSVMLILGVVLASAMGWIDLHGVNPG